MDDVRSPDRDASAKQAPPRDAAEEELWLAENAASIEAFNRWDERHGSPLDRFRKA